MKTATRPAAKARPAKAKIPLIELASQHKPLRRQLLAAMTEVLDSGSFILGERVHEFEKNWAAYTGAPYCLGVSSGTQAIELALEGAGVKPGDEVIVPALTFIASATAVSTVGATPVFCDINPKTLNVDAEALARKITAKTKAVLPVHLYGLPAEMPEILQLARSRGLRVIEDCCQAHGALYDGKHVGTLGDAGCFSFYPTKNLGAAGDAGAIITASRDVFDLCFMQRNIGRKAGERYNHTLVGYNYRLDELQAAVLDVKLKSLDAWTKERRRVAARYRKVLSGLPLELPSDGPRSRHSYHQFVVRSPRRADLSRWLSEAGIDNGVYYPIPLHLQPAYRDLGYRPGDLPQAERACLEVLSLPMYPSLKDGDIDRIGAEIKRFFDTTR